MHDDARLDAHDADEWFDIALAVRPDLTREEFRRMWDEFQALKRKKAQQ